MSAENHLIKSGDITLAMIEGTKLKAFCGISFVPTVTPGTSGRADDPKSPMCPTCVEARDICLEWSRVKDEKNRLIREMRMLENAHRTVITERRVRENTRASETVAATN